MKKILRLQPLDLDDAEILDVDDTSLNEWLELLRKPPTGKIFVRNMFPTDRHEEEWFQTAHSRPESDVRLLLRHFLVSTGSNPMDQISAQALISILGPRTSVDDLREHDRRLLRYVKTRGEYPVWEGLGWIIDLLPKHPRMALNVVDAFFQAYYGHLTDNYLSGLFDAQAIIRSRYIQSSHTADRATQVLLGLDWRELELLCGMAYNDMGFEVVVTPGSNDDGVDVFAANYATGLKGLIVLQAKKWNTKPVSKREVRELLGTIDRQRATKGVLVTTGRFATGALKEADDDPRIELLGREQILELLNEHCGADWFVRVDRLITYMKLEKTNPLRRNTRMK